MDSILEIAPENPVARDARMRAWNEVGSKFADSRAVGARAVTETQHWPGSDSTKKHEASAEEAARLRIAGRQGGGDESRRGEDRCDERATNG